MKPTHCCGAASSRPVTSGPYAGCPRRPKMKTTIGTSASHPRTRRPPVSQRSAIANRDAAYPRSSSAAPARSVAPPARARAAGAAAAECHAFAELLGFGSAAGRIERQQNGSFWPRECYNGLRGAMNAARDLDPLPLDERQVDDSLERIVPQPSLEDLSPESSGRIVRYIVTSSLEHGVAP